MRRLFVLAALLALVTPASADAAVLKPKPKRITTSLLSAGPALNGGTIAWAGWDTGDGVEIYTRTRNRRTTTRFDSADELSSTSAFRIVASSAQVGYFAVDERFEIRDPEAVAYHFGALTRDRTDIEHLSSCIVRERCTFIEGRGIDATGRYVAYGPFDDRTTEEGEVMLVTRPGSDRTEVVEVPRVRRDDPGNFRIAGRYLAYRADGGEIVVVDWKRNDIVRELRPPLRGAGNVTFDVDPAGRVAVGRTTAGRSTRSAYGLYDSRGRLRMFRARSEVNSPGELFIAKGLIARTRTGGSGKRVWEATTLSGRRVASLRVPAGASPLSDFDGTCLAWSEAARDPVSDRRALYVASVRRPSRGSICR